jgi:hypothetical protein
LAGKLTAQNQQAEQKALEAWLKAQAAIDELNTKLKSSRPLQETLNTDKI